MSFHPDSHLPDCMMPDGGECCAGYATICEDWHKQRRRIEKLERALHDLFWNTAMPANGNISRILVRHSRSQQKIASCTMLA
jgi:hypothetical protein